MDLVLINIRANEKAIKNAKTGEMTAVEMVMHIFGETKCDSSNTKANISAKKAKLGSQLNEIGLN
jgi:hypothetical protein